MKHLFLFLFILFVSVSQVGMRANAQTTKGDILIGGSGSGYYNKGGPIGSTERYLVLNPQGGKFLLDNLIFSIDMPLGYRQDSYFSNLWEERYRTFSAGVLPGLQLFIPLADNFFATLPLRLGYNYIYNTYSGRMGENKATEHLLQAETGIGLAWFVKNSTALTLEVPYTEKVSFKHNNSNYHFSLRIGFLVSIPQAK